MIYAVRINTPTDNANTILAINPKNKHPKNIITKNIKHPKQLFPNTLLSFLLNN